MVGYPESLTDPSYSSQILVLTYPLVGNYGVPARSNDPSVPSSSNPPSADTHHVPPPTNLLDTLPIEFESSKIHVAALVVANYHPSYSHHLATSSLGKWLKEQDIPAMWGVDTRMLTKRLRQGGSVLGRVLNRVSQPDNEDRGRDGVLGSVSKLLHTNVNASGRPLSFTDGNDITEWKSHFESIPFSDPNVENLVAKVSTKRAVVYSPDERSGVTKIMHPTQNRVVRVVAVDVGMKWNQIRCFRSRGVEVKVVPWVSSRSARG
jgi:carbamoyl-phosphate synthase/aspartate carbamoyltransferase